MSIYVSNLSYDVSEADLTAVFAEHGSVKRVQIPTDPKTGRMRGFCFVEMGTDAEEQAAIDALDGSEWMSRDLKVTKAKPRESSSAWSSGNTIVISGSPGAESQSEPQKSRSGSENWGESGDVGASEGKSSTSQATDLPKQMEFTGSELKIVLEGNLEDISKIDLLILVNHLQKLSGDSSLSIVHVEQGSIVLKLSGSEDGFRVIKHLWETGQISRLIGLPIESIDYETDSSETCEDFSTSTSNSQKNELDKKSMSEGKTNNYIYDGCIVHHNNQIALSSPVTQIENQGSHMSENYINNLQSASVANVANTVKHNARQQANSAYPFVRAE